MIRCWIPAALALLLAACAHRALSPEARRLLRQVETMGPAEKTAYLASPPYAAHYGLFRDLEPAPWGTGRVLCAFKRHQLGFESRLGALTAGPGAGIYYVEGDREHSKPSVLTQVSLDGALISSGALQVPADDVRLGHFVGRDVLFLRSLRELYAMDVRSTGTWKVQTTALNFAALDLGGGGPAGLFTHDSLDEGRLTAHANDGSIIWSRTGLQNLDHIFPIRLPGRREDSLLITSWGERARLEVLNAEGRVILSTPLAGRDFSMLVAGAPDKSGTLLYSAGPGWPNSRQFLRIWRLTERGVHLETEVELGWASVERILPVDLNGDGTPEILLGGSDGWLLAYSGSGRLLAEHKLVGKVTRMLKADLTGDGTEEAVIGLGDVIPPAIFVVGVIPDPGPWKP